MYMNNIYPEAPIGASDVFSWGGDQFYQLGHQTYRIKY